MAKQAYKMVRSEAHVTAPGYTPRDIVNMREALEEMATARCPLCRTMLIARMGRRGPGFYCRCTKRKVA